MFISKSSLIFKFYNSIRSETAFLSDHKRFKMPNSKITKTLILIIFLLTISKIYFYRKIEYILPLLSSIDYNHDWVPIFGSNTWIFNNHVAQYSTKLILQPNDTLVVEALVFFDYEPETSERVELRARCFVLLNKQLYITPIYETITLRTGIRKNNIVRLLWKVRCKLNRDVKNFFC